MRFAGKSAAVIAGLALAGWGLAGSVATASVTTSVTSDFNGDGYQDLAIGVDDGAVNGLSAAGYVAVMYGSANGLTTARRNLLHQSWGLLPGSAEAGDGFGASLAVGDFNGDRIADLAVGSPGEDLESGAPGTPTVVDGAGQVHVIFGGVGGFAGAIAITPANVKYTYAGSDLGAGDVNGDGLDELFVTQGIGSRTLSSYHWSPGSGMNPPDGRTSIGPGDDNINDFLVTDVTGDRRSDLVLSSYGHDASGNDLTDHVWIYPGQSGGLGDRRLVNTGGERLAAGDINKDGYPDLVIGDPRDPLDRFPAKGGQISVRHGSAQGLRAEKLIHQDTAGVPGADEVNDDFGNDVAVGDVTGDGYADVAIGVIGEDIGARDSAGGVVLLKGGSGGLTTTGAQSFSQDTAGIPGVAEAIDYFGGSVRLIDFNKDRKTELVIGSPGEDGHRGTITVLRGTANGAAATTATTFGAGTLNAPTGRISFGQVIAGGRDR